MLKNFKPIIQDIPMIFAEDVYLLSDSGNVLSGRHRGEPIKNVFDLIDSSGFELIRDNMFFAGLKPLLLVDSTKGPILIDTSFFGTYRTFIAIIPHFSRAEILAIVKEKLNSIVKSNGNLKDELEICCGIDFDISHDGFAERLLNTHRGIYYYRTHGRTNGELSMLMSEIAFDFSTFCGCDL